MPKTNLHEELIKLKRKSNLKINLDFNPDKIKSDKLFHIDEIKKIKPSGLKGNFVNSVYLSSSMGFGLRVEI